MSVLIRSALLAASGCLVLSACQSNGVQDRPASLTQTDEATVEALKAALSEAVGRAQIELGPGVFEGGSVASVLPPPLSPHEGRSPAQPIRFFLVIREGACFAVREDTGEAFVLDGVGCEPAP